MRTVLIAHRDPAIATSLEADFRLGAPDRSEMLLQVNQLMMRSLEMLRPG